MPSSYSETSFSNHSDMLPHSAFLLYPDSRVEVRVVSVGWLSFYDCVLIRGQKRFFKAVYRTLVMRIDVSF